MIFSLNFSFPSLLPHVRPVPGRIQASASSQERLQVCIQAFFIAENIYPFREKQPTFYNYFLRPNKIASFLDKKIYSLLELIKLLLAHI